MKRAALVAVATMLVATAGRVAARPASPSSSATSRSAGRVAPDAPSSVTPSFATLSPEQSRVFRAWMVRIVDAQIAAARHRAGTIAIARASSDSPWPRRCGRTTLAWRQANAIGGRVPPDLTLSPEQQRCVIAGGSPMAARRHSSVRWS